MSIKVVSLPCDGSHCVSDIDECKNPESCDNVTQICSNFPGYFNCSCREGYQYEYDGRGPSCRTKVNQSKIISFALGTYLRLSLFIYLLLFCLVIYSRSTPSSISHIYGIGVY
jgi:hypothetical protein